MCFLHAFWVKERYAYKLHWDLYNGLYSRARSLDKTTGTQLCHARMLMNFDRDEETPKRATIPLAAGSWQQCVRKGTDRPEKFVKDACLAPRA